MKTNATTLRTLVTDNRFEDTRLNEAQIGKEDYTELCTLYKLALEALTHWSAQDYAHASTKKHKDAAFAEVKSVLGIFATDESRIIIDEASLRTLRDLAIRPKRMYSDAYKVARKLVKHAEATLADRLEDLATLGLPAPNLDDETFSIDAYVDAIRTSNANTLVGKVDMLDMFVAAYQTLQLRNGKLEDVKRAGNWTWKRPQPTTIAEFATLVENYVGDCLAEGFNLKSYNETRKETKAHNDAVKAAVAEALKA